MYLFHGPQFADKRFYSGFVWAPKRMSLNPREADLDAVVAQRGMVPSVLTPAGAV